MVMERDSKDLTSQYHSLRNETLEPEDLTEPKPDVPDEVEAQPDDLLIEDFDSHLPSTVRLLYGPDNSKVYLLGTSHFSIESQNDVSTVIRNVHPHIVMVELCRGRAGILQMDEATLEREAKNLTFKKVQSFIKEHGLLYGVIYTLFVNMSAKLTAQLGMAPGGEFRRALAEVRHFPGTIIHFGDRPIQITLKRALYVLNWWKRIQLFWNLVTTDPEISPEEVERCKQKDVLEQLLDEMSEKFPEVEHVFIRERDIYMTHALQLATSTKFISQSSNVMEPTRVVGIVGIGHIAGISKLWGTIEDEQIPLIMTIPQPSTTSKLIKVTIKCTMLGAVLWGCYKIIPLPKSFL